MDPVIRLTETIVARDSEDFLQLRREAEELLARINEEQRHSLNSQEERPENLSNNSLPE